MLKCSKDFFSEIVPTNLDKEGRFLIPEKLKIYSNIKNEMTFIGQGYYFQIWEPKAAINRQKKSRERLIKEKKTNFKGVGQPLRIALTGSKFGPGIYDIIISLGKDEVIKRLGNKIFG